jgi:hypothetical protein
MAYQPLPPPTVPDLELSRYAYEELIRIAEELRGVTGVDYRTVPRVNKFGDAGTATTGTTYSDIWEVNNWPILATAETHNIVSTATADNQAGTGARSVTVTGLSAWDGSEISETINLHPTDGTIAVTTTNTFVCVYRMQVASWGSGKSNAGEISATASTAGTISAYIDTNNNQTLMACYAIPSGVQALVTKFYASIVAPTASRTAKVRLTVHEDPENTNATVVKSIVGLDTTGTRDRP